MRSRRLLGSNQDFVVGLLRLQVKELNALLMMIEESSVLDEHTESSLKRVERNIRGLRKLCSDN